ncbi:hypothetical protein NHX12_023747 [Muraenolepis orangiensis]|uniref:Transposase n=1 Tax=Muraenolepis orangiensis TaxID=630683 RepID=A0A9Q0IT27_9TELE|nr:hypothetical protein NHX12_023747 [Muraenolepis orangiensis]
MPPKPVKPTPGPSQASNLTANAGNAVDENLLKAIRNIVQSVIHEENNALREEIRPAVSPLKAALETCEGTLQEHEEGLNCLDSRLEAMEKQYDQLYDNYKILQAKTDDLENRGRRCNIRILHVKEGLESGNPTTFVANLLTEILGDPAVYNLHRLWIERDQRTGVAGLSSHDSTTSRRRSSAGLSKRRAEFIEVKKLLRGKEGVRYGLVYPARLRVSFQGEENMFDTPQAVKDFIANKM